MDISKTLPLLIAVQLSSTILFGQTEDIFKTDTAGVRSRV